MQVKTKSALQACQRKSPCISNYNQILRVILMISMLVKISGAKHEGIRQERSTNRVHGYNYVCMYVCKKGFLLDNRADRVQRENSEGNVS